MLWKLLRSLLFRLDPEWAHALGAKYLSLRGFTSQGQARIPRIARCKVELGGIPLDSPLGVAAGFDKDGELVLGLRSLGFGFVEVGSVTPRPQPGNPRPRIFRIPEAQALINRMGFNSEGMEAVAQRLTHLRAFTSIQFPIGVNLGKNRDTPLELAADDYVMALERLYGVADYLVVNLSSPNTPGLTGLQEGATLAPLLKKVREARDRSALKVAGHLRPLLLKLSPDLDSAARKLAAELAVEHGYGLIASNTSRRRDFPSLAKASAQVVAEEGGLSGAPLKDLALSQLRELRGWIGPKPLLISVGGLSSGQDARERLENGANLLQAYTAFIYSGPGFAARINRELSS